jgi:Uma2 family endonuclease
MSVATSPTTTPSPKRRKGEPAWEIAMLFPAQGAWTEADYLSLNSSNWMVELSDGCLEVLPLPNPQHQDIVEYLFTLLKAFVLARALGRVYFAPIPVRLWAGKFREPDVMFFDRDELWTDGTSPTALTLPWRL